MSCGCVVFRRYRNAEKLILNADTEALGMDMSEASHVYVRSADCPSIETWIIVASNDPNPSQQRRRMGQPRFHCRGSQVAIMFGISTGEPYADVSDGVGLDHDFSGPDRFRCGHLSEPNPKATTWPEVFSRLRNRMLCSAPLVFTHAMGFLV